MKLVSVEYNELGSVISLSNVEIDSVDSAIGTLTLLSRIFTSAGMITAIVGFFPSLEMRVRTAWIQLETMPYVEIANVMAVIDGNQIMRFKLSLERD